MSVTAGGLPCTVQAVIYDLDGTLIDSAADIAQAVNGALCLRDLPQLSAETVARLIGTGARGVCKQSLQELGYPASASYLDKMVEDFLRIYKEAPVIHTKPYPNVVAGLVQHAANGIKQGVCTNKSGAIARQVIAQLGMAKYFDAVLAADEVPACKPDPGHLLAVVDQLGCEKAATVYVGDTVVDMECARAAGMPFALVAWGSQQAKQAGYGKIIDDIGVIWSG